MGQTIAQTGLTIERNDDLNFICSWKYGDVDYANGQNLEYFATGWKKWEKQNIDFNDTECVISLNKSDWYPYTNNVLKRFIFGVQGTRSDEYDDNPSETKWYDWKAVNGTNYGAVWEQFGYGNQYSRVHTTYAPSSWTYKTKYIYAPDKPSLSAELDSERNNVTKFSWTIVDDENSDKPFTMTEYQSMVVENLPNGSLANLDWSQTSNNEWYAGYRYNESEAIEIEDDIRTATSDLSSWRSRSRVFRVRAVGPGGASNWSYDKHVYAKPYRPEIGKVTYANEADLLGMSIFVEWTSNANAAHPIDSIDVQYLIDTPEAGLTCPSGANWQVAATLADSPYTDAEKITIDTRPGADQCLWVRIVARHDALETATAPYLVRKGSLTAPAQIDSLKIFEGYCSAEIGVTNASTVEDSKIAIVFWREESGKSSDEYVCGIIDPNNSSYRSPIVVYVNFNPDDTIWFGAYAFQGTYKSSQRSDGKTQWTVTANMKSSTTWYGGEVPPIPTLRVTSDRAGEAHVDWTWNWVRGIQAEISWSKDQYAWNSIEGPQTYIVDNMHRSDIRIPNLETGVKWYFRARLGKDYDGSIVYGPYSNTVSIDMSTVPEKPFLTASTSIALPWKNFNVFWSYKNEDGRPQANAEIYFCRINEDDSVSNIQRAARVSTANSATISTPYVGWSSDSGSSPDDIVVDGSFYLRAFVQSSSGIKSEYSDPIKINVGLEPRCYFLSVGMTKPSSQQDVLRHIYRLRSMPFTARVEGSDEGIMSLIIKRAEPYRLDRPDESVFNGFEGEIVFSASKTNNDGFTEIDPGLQYPYYVFTITNDMLTGTLDDGAKYTIMAIFQDKYGQVATASEEFIVEWTRQAIIPQATASIETLAALITPIAPTGTGTGDTVDIYRLSADKPELIVQNGSFGTTYVDPYPASGIFGGHRVVYKTVNGDFITADNRPAWIDLGFDDGDYVEFIDTIIDFGGERVTLRYNMDLDNSWKKDFEETKYLGGSVQGDWNPGVSRTGSVNGVVVSTTDKYLVRQMRRLAAYSGICHVRTPEGSSFSANVEVSESRDLAQGMGLVNFTLNFTRVDSEGLDGIAYEDWVVQEE